MQSIFIEIPYDIASQLKLPPKRAKKMIMQELVIRLYEQEIITSAQGERLLETDSALNGFWLKTKLPFTANLMN